MHFLLELCWISFNIFVPVLVFTFKEKISWIKWWLSVARLWVKVNCMNVVWYGRLGWLQITTAMPLLNIMSFFYLVDNFEYLNLIQWETAFNNISERINPFKCQSSECVCKLLVYYVTFTLSITVVWLLKYTICVIVYCDVVNVKPCFNFSDEIMSNLELLVLKYTIYVIVYCDVVNI